MTIDSNMLDLIQPTFFSNFQEILGRIEHTSADFIRLWQGCQSLTSLTKSENVQQSLLGLDISGSQNLIGNKD